MRFQHLHVKVCVVYTEVAISNQNKLYIYVCRSCNSQRIETFQGNEALALKCSINKQAYKLRAMHKHSWKKITILQSSPLLRKQKYRSRFTFDIMGCVSYNSRQLFTMTLALLDLYKKNRIEFISFQLLLHTSTSAVCMMMHVT